VNYDVRSHVFYNWATFVHPINTTFENWHTHFEGISYNMSTKLYYLSADNLRFRDDNVIQTAIGSFVQVKCNFDDPINPLFPCQQHWHDLHFPSYDGGLTSNSVAEYDVVGLVANGSSETLAFTASINNTEFIPFNDSCPFYKLEGRCYIYTKAYQTLYFNGCNRFCSGNQTLAVNFTGILEYIPSDNSCGGCFTGKVKIPNLIYNVDSPSFTIVYEGCVGNCTGNFFI
jgi:hypothetical protein